MFLKTLWFGSFLLDNTEVVDYSIFPQGAQEIALRYQMVRDGEVLEEEKGLASFYQEITVDEPRLLRLGNAVMVGEGESGTHHDSKSIHPGDYQISSDLLHSALLIVYSGKLTHVLQEREIIELIGALNDLDQTLNLLREREMEWEKTYTRRETAHIFQDFKKMIQALEEFKERLTGEIEQVMRKKNPTLSVLIGELLSARLIALAGSRKRLARLPASTIQILGAENAFFRFRRFGRGMPKHGIIFRHPWLRGSRKSVRGKVARALSGKIAIAARIDYYSGRDEGEALRSAVEERILEIRMEKIR
ncbi:MAG: RNA-binding protein [Thermoplasmata archaeon]|nr:RNA-binding protein [Thermoplasmata archaeon]